MSATKNRDHLKSPFEQIRVHHERIEAWILEQAGVAFDASAKLGNLRVMTSAA